MTVETNLEKFRRKAIEREFKHKLEGSDIQLDDGSGQQVGTYNLNKSKELSKSVAKKKMAANKDSGEQSLTIDPSVQAGISTAMQGGSLSDIAGSVGQAALISEISGGIAAGTKAATAAKAGAAKAGAGAAGLKAGAAAINPWVLGAAAGIGLLSASAKRKQAKREAEARAISEQAKGKERESQALANLSKSIQEILI